MKKNIKLIVSLVLVVGAFGVMWWAAPRNNSAASPSLVPTKSTSALVAGETFYDFKTISMKKGNVSHVFKVTNTTAQDISVPSVTTSCMCTVAYLLLPDGSKKGPFGMPGMAAVPKANDIIKAGETRDVEVVYDPNAHGPAGVGAIDRFIYLEDASGGKITLEIKAVVTP